AAGSSGRGPDQGFLVGFGVAVGLGVGVGDGLADGSVLTASSTAWGRPDLDSQTSVAGPSSTPGRTYRPRRSCQSVPPPARRYWPRYRPVALSHATIRALGWS